MARSKSKADKKHPKRGARPRGRPPGSSKRLDFNVEEFLQEMPHLEAVQWVEIECPYCSEVFDTRVDPSQEFANYVEDCQVCCKPITLDVQAEDGDISVFASRA